MGQQGTPHLQGYVEFSKRLTMSNVHDILGSRLALLVTKGSGKQNRQYCSKTRETDDIANPVFHECGALRNQGKRNDLNEIRAELEDGATMQQIAQTHFGNWVRYRASFQAYRTLLRQKELTIKHPLESFPVGWRNDTYNWNKTQIFWGESQIGKTCFAMALLGPRTLMVSHTDDLIQFDESIHDAILFDDMDFKHFPKTAQIHLMDQDFSRSIHCRYTNAFIPANTKKVFTTNEEGGMCVDLMVKAIKNRVQVHHFLK